MGKGGMNSRRDFLKAGLAGAAGMAVMSCTGDKAESGTEKKQKVVTRKLGRTGIVLPVISIGTGDTNDSGLIKAALEMGVKLYATSQYYGNGNNEKMLAEVFEEKQKGDAIVVTSTAPDNYDYRKGVFNKGAKVEPFLERFESSLRRLGSDGVDIMLLPSMATKESVFYEPYLRAMEDIKKQGKARFVGIATHSLEHEALRAAADTGVYDVAMVAYNYRKKNLAELDEALEYATGKGMGIIAMKTMAGSYLDEERTQPVNTLASLKWVLRNENIHTTVPGVTTFDQLRSDFAVMADMSLTDAEKADLELSMRSGKDGPFCQQCGRCVPQCRLALDIPTIMRSHMYAFGYRNLATARETLDLAIKDSDPCGRCQACSVTCAMGHDVRGKVTKISRLADVPREFLG
jgi:aryl-alcohol dehydrogenase-like predicted oxidoreductase